jgi:membrane-associated HD superfamily phosphohydrolase
LIFQNFISVVKKRAKMQRPEMYSDDDNDSRYTLGSDSEEEGTIDVEEEESSIVDEFEEEYEGQLNFLEQEDEYFDDDEEQLGSESASVRPKVPLTSRGWNTTQSTVISSMEDIMKEQVLQKKEDEVAKKLYDERKKKLENRPSFNFSDNSKNPRFFKRGAQKYESRSRSKYFNPKRNET